MEMLRLRESPLFVESDQWWRGQIEIKDSQSGV